MRVHELVKSLAVDSVDGRPRALAPVDPVHGRAIDGLPVIEKPSAVEREPVSSGKRPELAENGAPPVNDRAVGIEGERLNHRPTQKGACYRPLIRSRRRHALRQKGWTMVRSMTRRSSGRASPAPRCMVAI